MSKNPVRTVVIEITSCCDCVHSSFYYPETDIEDWNCDSIGRSIGNFKAGEEEVPIPAWCPLLSVKAQKGK